MMNSTSFLRHKFFETFETLFEFFETTQFLVTIGGLPYLFHSLPFFGGAVDWTETGTYAAVS